MKNIEELNFNLKELNKRKLIYTLYIILGISTIIIGIICKVPTLNGALVLIGIGVIITFSILNSKNNNKIFETKKQIYDISTMTKAIEDSKK